MAIVPDRNIKPITHNRNHWGLQTSMTASYNAIVVGCISKGT